MRVLASLALATFSSIVLTNAKGKSTPYLTEIVMMFQCNDLHALRMPCSLKSYIEL